MDRNWKKLFEQKIRSRGKKYSYFCVSDYRNDENGYQATVRGSEDYKVYISSDYKNMSCTCPYAKDGKHCKHSDKNKQLLKTALTAYEFNSPAKEEMLEGLTKE